MRRIVVTKTQVWEAEIPDVGYSSEKEFLDLLLADASPDYEDVEVEEL